MTDLAELPTSVLEAYCEAHEDEATPTVWDFLDELSERGYAVAVEVEG
jgi:hypothetical protein